MLPILNLTVILFAFLTPDVVLRMLKNCKAGKIYVTAFPDFKEFKKHTADLACETEVWVVSFPDHMIHFNGDKFVGPR